MTVLLYTRHNKYTPSSDLFTNRAFHLLLVVIYSFCVQIVILWIVLRYLKTVWLHTAKMKPENLFEKWEY